MHINGKSTNIEYLRNNTNTLVIAPERSTCSGDELISLSPLYNRDSVFIICNFLFIF